MFSSLFSLSFGGENEPHFFTTPLLRLQKEKVIVFCMSMYDLNLMVFLLAIHTVPPIPPPDPLWYAKQYKHEADINTLARASVHLGI